MGGLVAAGFAVMDVSKSVASRVASHTLSAERRLHDGMRHVFSGDRARQQHEGCRLHVHLICGRQVTRKGRSVNAFARIQLYDPPVLTPPFSATLGPLVMEVPSKPRMWTMRPSWDQYFDIGPVRSRRSILRIACYHRKTTDVMVNPN